MTVCFWTLLLIKKNMPAILLRVRYTHVRTAVLGMSYGRIDSKTVSIEIKHAEWVRTHGRVPHVHGRETSQVLSEINVGDADKQDVFDVWMLTLPYGGLPDGLLLHLDESLGGLLPPGLVGMIYEYSDDKLGWWNVYIQYICFEPRNMVGWMHSICVSSVTRSESIVPPGVHRTGWTGSEHKVAPPVRVRFRCSVARQLRVVDKSALKEPEKQPSHPPLEYLHGSFELFAKAL